MKKIILGVMSLFMWGCSSVPEPVVKQSPEDTEWQQLKPSLKRLVALEGDLKELIGELAVLKQSGELSPDAGNVEVNTIEKTAFAEQPIKNAVSLPVQQVAPAQAEEKRTETKIASQVNEELVTGTIPGVDVVVKKNPEPPPVAMPEPPAVSGVALQLASLTSHVAALNTWTRYSNKQKYLVSYIPLVEKALVKGNTYYRLKLSGFQTEQEAKDVCGKLYSNGIKCYLTNPSGDQLQMLANR